MGIDKWEIIGVLKKIKLGKARGPDGLAGEQIKWGGAKLWDWVVKLVKGVIQHGCVLDNTLESWVKPILKDKKGNSQDSNNYRGVALSSAWAKIIDNVILLKINRQYKVDGCQFGFKKGLSSKMAIQVLVELGNRYCKLGGSLVCGFVDLTKAFDRLEYGVIWEKLKRIGMGKNLIRIIEEQYRRQYMKVVWGDLMSDSFKVDRGVRPELDWVTGSLGQLGHLGHLFGLGHWVTGSNEKVDRDPVTQLTQ